MTLINFLTRIHFADGVLGEALRSEMERLGWRRPLIVASSRHLESALGQNICSSFAVRTKIQTYSDIEATGTEDAADGIAKAYQNNDHDVMVAFGDDNAIDLAKTARLAILRKEPVGNLISEEGGTHGIDYTRPGLIAIPDISGISASISSYAKLKLNTGKQVILESCKMIPDIVICDPMVTLESSREECAKAAAGVISHGVSAYFAKGYNPPADGLALDSLNRIVRNTETALNPDELAARREMMAGCLNSALSMQKGLCAVHAVSSALASVAERKVDFGSIGRLLMPQVVELYEDEGNPRNRALKRSLMIHEDMNLAKGISGLLRPLPLPQCLSDMGILKSSLARAADLASANRAIRNGPRKIRHSDVLSMLEAVY